MTVKKIVLVGEDLCIRKEGIAGGSITPGHLVAGAPGGTITALASAASAVAKKQFAYEREMTGDGITVAYAASDTVLYFTAPPGAVVYALTAAAVTAGDALEASATAGALQTRTTGRIIGYALETVGSAGRCKIEVA